MIGSCVSKGVTCQLTSVNKRVVKYLSGGGTKVPVAQTMVPRAPVLISWRNGSALWNSRTNFLVSCKGCGSGAGWAVPQRNYRQEKQSQSVLSRLEIVNWDSQRNKTWDKFQARFKGGFSDFGHNPKWEHGMSPWSIRWGKFLALIVLGTILDWES